MGIGPSIPAWEVDPQFPRGPAPLKFETSTPAPGGGGERGLYGGLLPLSSYNIAPAAGNNSLHHCYEQCEDLSFLKVRRATTMLAGGDGTTVLQRHHLSCCAGPAVCDRHAISYRRVS